MFHGFPGNEQNLDLAQAIRRAGFTVLTLHYRGAWGSPGVFSFTHALEDADAALAWLRDPATVAKFNLDPAPHLRRRPQHGRHDGGQRRRARSQVAGAGDDLGLGHRRGRVRISPIPNTARSRWMRGFGEEVIPLAGATPDGLMDEAAANAAKWDFVDYAADLEIAPRPDPHRR